MRILYRALFDLIGLLIAGFVIFACVMLLGVSWQTAALYYLIGWCATRDGKVMADAAMVEEQKHKRTQ